MSGKIAGRSRSVNEQVVSGKRVQRAVLGRWHAWKRCAATSTSRPSTSTPARDRRGREDRLARDASASQRLFGLFLAVEAEELLFPFDDGDQVDRAAPDAAQRRQRGTRVLHLEVGPLVAV